MTDSKPSNAHLHLTMEERNIIKTGIENGSSKVAIANTLGKEKSTIGKEIKLHRTLKYKCKMSLECAVYKKCKHGRDCHKECPDYKPFTCKRRDRTPGACNGCPTYKSCHFNKYIYDPTEAHHEYRDTLVKNREGFNLTTDEVKFIADIVGPLLEQGLSPYAILQNHPEIGISVKTLYNYIESGLFKSLGYSITNLDLRRQTRRIGRKPKVTYKKREDKSFLKGRTYKDYEAYMEEYPEATVVQMDTVYNNGSTGPFIQTFKLLKYHLLIAIFHEQKTAQEMVRGLDLLEDILGSKLFASECQVALTDRGTEFSAADSFEHREGEERLRTRIFYCDPMQSSQKGSLENNHIELRYILPKEKDLRNLGLADQQALNVVISHINSFPKKVINDLSPLEYLEFMNKELFERLKAFGVTKIDRDKVTLKPYILKNKAK